MRVNDCPDMIKNLLIDSFIQLDSSIPVVDVRTPAEFEKGHIVGAFNIPLFSNEERVQVGTTYKQKGREQAILLGFDLTGSKWSGFIKQALELSPQKKIALHCWRGGMRSGAMAWALNFYGFDVYLLEGGYKQYRRWVLEQFERPYNLLILGGMTGSGKTQVLHQLKILGEQVVDLEDLAQHQGSTYGSMNKLVQPTQEQFENMLASALFQTEQGRHIWLEDESKAIGKSYIPGALYSQMIKSPMFNIKIPLDHRVAFLVDEYGGLDKEFLVECTNRIRKRLGPEQAKNAVLAINEGRMADFIRQVLVYYDKTYFASLCKRLPENVRELNCPQNNAQENALLILACLAKTLVIPSNSN